MSHHSTIIETAAYISMSLLLVALILGFWRLLKGPTLADRVLVLDLISFIVIGMTIALAATSGEVIYLDAAVVLALISFMGTVAFAQFLKKRYYDR
jgi:multicomponent Na+:H+ antiporter subunit F